MGNTESGLFHFTLLVIKKLSNVNSWSKTDIKIWNNIINGLWKAKKMVKGKIIGQRYFVIYKRSPLKMQKIIKPRSPSRQLLETVNFAFMKIVDFLVKIALFSASLLFFGRFPSCFIAVIEQVIREEMHDANLPKKGDIP